MQTNTEKIELTGYLILGEIKLYKLKNVYFEEKISKNKKKHNNFTFHDYLEQYYSSSRNLF